MARRNQKTTPCPKRKKPTLLETVRLMTDMAIRHPLDDREQVDAVKLKAILDKLEKPEPELQKAA